MPRALEDKVYQMIVEGKAPLFKRFIVGRFVFYAEEWELCCVEHRLSGDDNDDDLIDLVWEEAEKIQVEEGWDGFFYIPPDECDALLGITVFYKLLFWVKGCGLEDIRGEIRGFQSGGV